MSDMKVQASRLKHKPRVKALLKAAYDFKERTDPAYKHLNFPKPVVINGIPQWRESVIDQWADSFGSAS